MLNKCFMLLAVLVLPLCADQPVKQPHKPPILTTTAIIEIYEAGDFKGIVLIERGKAPWGKAIPGGKVEYGETVENAVRREMMEEVNLDLSDLRQFHVYSDPTRDFRHHSVEVAHTAKAYTAPTAGDDAAKAFVVKLEDIPWNELAFDHAVVLKDYLAWRNGNSSVAMPLQKHDIQLDVKINCPKSPELTNFIKSIPQEGQHTVSFAEWKSSFVASMEHLIQLVKTGNVSESLWSVKVDEHLQSK